MAKAASKLNGEENEDEIYELNSQSDINSDKLGGLNIRMGAETFIGKRAQDLLNL